MATREHITSYLGHIQFDPKLATSFKAKYLTNPRFVILLIISILAVGISSFISLPRRLNPEVKLPIVSVATTLPGASPKDIESLITIPLEEKIAGVKDIKTLSSQSVENASIITVEFNSGVNVDEAKIDIQSQVDSVQDLPEDATTPRVEALDFENQTVWKFALTSNSDVASLSRFAETLKDRLENVKSISNVVLTGKETQEIMVVIKPESLSTYNVNPVQLSQAIKATVASLPAGNIVTSQSVFSLALDPTIAHVNDLRSLQVSLQDPQTPTQTRTVPLSAVATVVERSTPTQAQSFLASNETAAISTITFSIFKTEAANIDASVKEAERVVDETLKGHNGQFAVQSLMNTAEEIEDQSGELIANFRDTLILVFITLFIFLGLRQAIIAVVTIPLTFLVTFAIMQVAGLTINFLSLFSLLLALGLLVDDTIVVVTAMTAYNRVKKFTPTQTGLLVWRDFIIPIWSTTITTVWAFLPLLLSTGIIGEFIKTIPIVVAAALYTSTAIAMFVTLPLMMIVYKPQIPLRVKVLVNILLVIIIGVSLFYLVRNNPLLPLIIVAFVALLAVTLTARQSMAREITTRIRTTTPGRNFSSRFRKYANEGVLSMPKLAEKYQVAVTNILASQAKRLKTIAIVVAFMVFSFLLVPLGFVVNEFFPKSDANQLFVNVELPQGTNIVITNAEAKNLLNELRTIEGPTYISAEVGTGLDPASFTNVSGSHIILYTLNLERENGEKVSSIALAEVLRKRYANYQKGKFSVVELSGGPPAGADVQVKLSGPNLQRLQQYADQLVAHLKSQQGITNVTKSIKPGTSKLVFIPNSAKLAENSLINTEVGLWLRTYASGFMLDEVKFNGEQQDIIFRFDPNIQSPQSLGTLYIPTQRGPVSLLSLGEIQLKTNPTIITRENEKRTISVAASVTQGFSVTQANTQALDFVKNMNLEEGYEYSTGGVNEENQASVNSILIAMILAALLIITTMVIQFGSFRKAFIVMLVIPPAVSGVFLIFALTGTPLSFPALIGVLALFGIVVNNSMMLLDKINQNLKIGMRLKQAIADASASRLEPILLTKICTIVGLIPITITDPLWRGLGGAIISGLLFSGLIMLFLIPVVYYMFYNRYEKQLLTANPSASATTNMQHQVLNRV